MARDHFAYIKSGNGWRLIPYPLRAARLNLSLKFNLLDPWLLPQFTWKRNLTEQAKKDGETIWWARWLYFQVSYSRWV